MNIIIFNSSLLAGWVMVLVGGVWLHPAWGLVAGGLLLLVLVIFVTRLAGIYRAESNHGAD